MFGYHFYHSSLKKVVAGFGKLFADIHIIRRFPSGAEKERIKVPLAYGPSEKFLARFAEDPELDRGFAIKLPRMAFQIQSVQYDSTRKLNTLKKNVQPIQDEQGNVIRQYQGVPYKINIDLFILSKYIEDANQIVEQILPWFTPAYTITINSIPSMNYKDDVPVMLSSVSLSDNYEDDWKNRRDITWTMSFSIDAMFYGPVAEKKIVTSVQTDLRISTTSADLSSQEFRAAAPRVVRLTTNPADEFVMHDEDFGYITETEQFLDGKAYDPVTGQDIDAAVTLKPKSAKYTGKVIRPKLV
jgi:hypothetical protein